MPNAYGHNFIHFDRMSLDRLTFANCKTMTIGQKTICLMTTVQFLRCTKAFTNKVLIDFHSFWPIVIRKVDICPTVTAKHPNFKINSFKINEGGVHFIWKLIIQNLAKKQFFCKNIFLQKRCFWAAKPYLSIVAEIKFYFCLKAFIRQCNNTWTSLSLSSL